MKSNGLKLQGEEEESEDALSHGYEDAQEDSDYNPTPKLLPFGPGSATLELTPQRPITRRRGVR